MEWIIICLVAAAASMLTFFSGFGLGTLLSPVLMLFFPVEQAIAMTGVVHFLNNLFKIFLTGRHIQWSLALTFGITALAGSFLGANMLVNLSNAETVLYTWSAGDKEFRVTGLKLVIAALMLMFVFLESNKKFKQFTFGRKAMLPGGLISGFFGGLSGHQGALRSMFLLKSGLSKEAYIATGILIACMVDISRLSVYAGRMQQSEVMEHGSQLLAAVLSAFTGAWIGNRWLKKITLESVQLIVSVLLVLLALALALGVI